MKKDKNLQTKTEGRQCKIYKKNKLSKQIRRTLNRSNAISTVFLTGLILLVISGLVSFLGMGFSKYTADEIAKDVAQAYEQSMDCDNFKSGVAHLTEEGPTSAMKDNALMVREAMIENGNIDNIQNLDMAMDMFDGFRFFDYQIYIHGQLIYDSMETDYKTSEFEKMGKNGAKKLGMFTGYGADLTDSAGELIGKVKVSLSHDIVTASYSIALILAFIVLCINLVVGHVVAFISSKMVARPLEVLADQMAMMADEELEDAFNMELVIKKPVSEVMSLKASSEKIMAKISEYYQTMLAQNQELEAQRDVLTDQRDELEAQKEEMEAQRDELEAQNEELTVTGDNLQSMNNAYLSRTLKLQNLMDNIGQGFMTFNESLKVNPEYSIVCSEIVHGSACGQAIEGRNITELLSDDPEQQEFLGELFIKIIQGKAHERALFIPLLPEEIYANGTIQKVEYKIVRDEQFNEQMMIILTDITQTRALEKQVNQERDTLQMIVKVLMNREDFIEQVDNFSHYLEEVFDNHQEKNCDNILRNLHTYKGTFSQYYMHGIVGKLNDLEDMAYEEDVEAALKAFGKRTIMDALTKDLDIITAYVGEDFVKEKEQFTVREEKILEIEDKIRKILPATEYNKVIPIIKSIRYKSVKESLKHYPDYTMKLADRLEKSIAPFEITGDDIFVDYDIYQSVLKAMVHLFRNAVDHGVEDVDSRIEAGKVETAHIRCHVEKLDDSFAITVEDDGRGIDTKALLAKAMATGRWTEADAMALSEQERLALIFDHGVSTKEQATVISGRGVGLAAVKELVSYLGGHITIDSKPGEGTSLKVVLPILEGADIVTFEPNQFLAQVEDVASDYFKGLGLSFGGPDFFKEDRITLHRVNALLSMKGSMDGLIVISCNERCARNMVKAFIYEEVTEEEQLSYAEDVLGEVTNTIMGNVLGSFEKEGVYLTLGVPVMLSNKSAYIKYSNRQILSAKYEKNGDILTISLLLTDGSVPMETELELSEANVEGEL